MTRPVVIAAIVPVVVATNLATRWCWKPSQPFGVRECKAPVPVAAQLYPIAPMAVPELVELDTFAVRVESRLVTSLAEAMGNVQTLVLPVVVAPAVYALHATTTLAV